MRKARPSEGAGLVYSSTKTDLGCRLLVGALSLKLDDERFSTHFGIETNPRQDDFEIA